MKNRSSRRATAVLAGSVISALALAATAQAGPGPAPPGAAPGQHQPTTATPLDPTLRNLKAPDSAGQSSITTSSADPTEQVDPLIGTTNAGNVFPGAVTPFGMFSFSPETSRGNAYRTAAPGGYLYSAPKIRGFSLTHMSGTGCAGGSGDIPILPYAGDVTSSPQADAKDEVYASTFSHANEIAKPGYYKVGLDSGASAELAATTRTGSAKFTFPQDKPATVMFRTSNSEVGSSDAQVSIDPARQTVTGSVTSGNFCGYLASVGQRSYYTLHFVAEFDQPFAKTGTWQDTTVTPGSTSAHGGTTYGTDGWMPANKGSGGYVGFDAKTVNMRIGISYVSEANAAANLKAENPRGTSLDKTASRAKQAWRDQLNSIEIGGGTADRRTTFYTALYHALLHPNVFSDVNGQYWGFDQKPHRVQHGQTAQYATFSGWDVYRSQLQLLTLLEPRKAGDIAQSLLNQAQQNNGIWDRWTHASGSTAVMTGDPSAPAVAGIYAFGGTNFDARTALKSLVKAATVPTEKDLSSAGKPVMSIGQRPSLDKYLALHYLPTKSNAWGGAVETLEDTTDDFALAQLAARVGDKSTYDQFLRRSQYWQNVFNPENGGYIQNRDDNGAWPGFDPATGDGFAEGSSAQYTWMIPHNRAGLFDAMGGTAKAADRLDAFFKDADGNWALTGSGDLHAEMDNEPSINTPWIYNYVGQPYKTQETLRQAMTQLWNTTTGGIPGNDDLGAMSSWFVWTALGLYPDVPSRADLQVGAPLFPSAVIHRDKGRTIRINAAGAPATYVQSLKVDGRSTSKAWLSESFANRGGTLDFKLGTTANTAWGAAAADAPPSWRTGEIPFQTATDKSRVVVAPGTTSEPVTIKAHRLSGDASTVQYSVTTPAGLTASPASGSFTVDQASGVGGAPVRISAAAGTPDGRYQVTVALKAGDGTALPRLGFTVVVGLPNTFSVLREGVAASDDAGDHNEADYDGGGVSYSRQALTAAGLAPGGTVTKDGLTLTWPDVPVGDPDNVPADGQLLNLDLPAGATKLSFVGSAVNGNQQTTATLMYSDGSTAPIDLSFSDWTLGGGGDTVHYGNLVLATTPYRNEAGGGRDNVATNIFATAPVTFPAGKAPVSVTLPKNRDLRIFTLATG
ncbi:GH92 family glycosyl hydrolase [Kribbella qitaiheensis]|uniref:GH92 family glycosyl hydrolase n=1 Tax=Kribbella qitaiheensis TaxID=1544730 RepID=UPI001FE75247|nr:GH92 family glycosyl hydrolase [Kribbella qitaiheensis]